MNQYFITPKPLSHQWHITFIYTHESGTPHHLKLANWVAGSYMIRDFSRHIMHIKATRNGENIPIIQLDKNTWSLPDMAGTYQIEYIVYANDLSVRASLLDDERGFIDGACLFLYRPDSLHQSSRIEFCDLPENWQIITSLPSLAPHILQAADYAQLVDNPIEMGANIEILSFHAKGIAHRIALSGHYPDFDRQRLIDDCQKICTQELEQFSAPAPFQEYVFLLHLGDNIYGGLEHRSSTALHADRNALPPYHMNTPNSAYIELLGLIAHEYFHAWNVKSIKPTKFQPYDLNQEIYTEQLWAYEGFTSYYDDLTLVRSRVIGIAQYLDLLAKNITFVQRSLGRRYQTLAQSSFCAWHKYYKQDENSPNAITSYYRHGALFALCLDLTIRARSPYSLDSVMNRLYQRFQNSKKGTDEHEWTTLIQEYTDLDLNDFFQAALYTNDDLPLERCLKNAGIALQWQPENRQNTGKYVEAFHPIAPQAEIGCRYTQQADGALITHVYNGGAAEKARLKAGDKIIAINHFACTKLSAQTQNIGAQYIVHFFRAGVLHETQLTMQAAIADCAHLKIDDLDLLNQWIFGKS